ncbi:MAG: phosphoribosylformylglycinamidine synthase subunit PurQ, partial [Alistipes sp.]|nr:phosphoribosylformylglycinamidine synthase subunit PurQ [Alistipes sp.]
RRPEVTRLIKKSNDFGAGGVSVAIGELAPGLDIYLDRVPAKYSGLNSTELAISESQERMAVVVERKDMEEMIGYCHEENIEVTHVADVTDTNRMKMFYGGELIVNLSRKFIDSAGAKHYTKIRIAAVEDKDPFQREVAGESLAEKVKNNLEDDNVVSQRGMIEMFDSTIGCSTVLMPFGGKTQNTETQVSVQKLPVGTAMTNTASIMTFGYNPFITSWSPYHGAAYAVVEAAAKVVAAGARYDKMRYSYQEYFERMNSEASWGKPLAALLGALKMQIELGLPSIGGKDSMSGTFQDINVPPMLMAFGITTVDARTVISPELKQAGHKLYLIKHTPLNNYMPDTEQLKENFSFVSSAIEQGKIVAGYAVGFGGVQEAIAKMSFGNLVGASIDMPEQALFDYNYGSIVVEATEDLNFEAAELIGQTVGEEYVTFNGEKFAIDELQKINSKKFCQVYPDRGLEGGVTRKSEPEKKAIKYSGAPVDEVKVYIPVFPGTNCDYDTAKAFERAGATVTTSVFCDLTAEDIFASIEKMKQMIDECHIFMLSGGFSAGDEPDGSGKFIANVLNNKVITDAIHALLDRGGLILGICNGFQALVKSGLLPYGRLGQVVKESPTLFRNDINRHISQIVTTRVATTASPWLSSFELGEEHAIAVSHGEGKFVVSEEMAEELFANGQVAFQYVDPAGEATLTAPYNPNGSSYGIEGIISANGQILGKMGHTERYDENLFKNIHGNKVQSLFQNAVNYFKGK